MRTRKVAATALCAALLAGCSAPTLSELPDGLAISMYQTRVDAAARQIQFHLDNLSSEAVTITAARLHSELFVEPLVWSGESTIPASYSRDLKAVMPVANCAADPGELSFSVTVDFVLGDGRTGTATVVPGDPNGILRGLTREECLGEALNSVATIEMLALDYGGEGAVPAILRIQLTPTGNDGDLRVSSIEGTNLISLADEAGLPVKERDLGLAIDAATEPVVIEVPVVPNRCDPHAVAEDKQGTFFPLNATASSGAGGTFRVVAPDAVRTQLYDFVARYCGF